MDETRVVIIQHNGKPLMFSDGIVVVYPTIADAQRDFMTEYDKEIISFKEYKKSELYKVYNKFSIEM